LLYFNMCYLGVSAGVFFRLLIGHESVACQNLGGEMKDVVVVAKQGVAFGELVNLGSIPCLVIFATIYYFLMAASMWWVTLNFSWYLSAAKGWCPEAFTK
jgi:hypothetical protein